MHPLLQNIVCTFQGSKKKNAKFTRAKVNRGCFVEISLFGAEGFWTNNKYLQIVWLFQRDQKIFQLCKKMLLFSNSSERSPILIEYFSGVEPNNFGDSPWNFGSQKYLGEKFSQWSNILDFREFSYANKQVGLYNDFDPWKITKHYTLCLSRFTGQFFQMYVRTIRNIF